MATENSTPATSVSSSTWPGAFGIYKISAEAVKKNAGEILILILITIAASIIFGQIFKDAGDALSSLIGGLVALPLTLLYLASVRGKELSLTDSTKQPLELYLKMVVLQIVTSFAMLVSLLLLIVPFFFVFPRLVLASYYQVDKPEIDPIQAMKASWNNTQGHVAKVYGIVGVSLLMALLFVTIIGIPVALYLLFMYSASLAVLYEFINRR